MEKLPPELLTKVVDYVGDVRSESYFNDLKCLRVMTRNLRDIAAVQLYRTVVLWISRQSVQNLYNIAGHSTLCVSIFSVKVEDTPYLAI